MLYIMFVSFMVACDCLDLIDRQLFNPLPVCSGGGGTITGAISNGGATYTSLAINFGRATYQCDEGYSISGDNARECQGDGSWSGSPPTCQLQGGIRILYVIREANRSTPAHQYKHPVNISTR